MSGAISSGIFRWLRHTAIKRLVGELVMPTGAVRRICFGPLAGMIYRVGAITGLSAIYSGPERAHQTAFRKLVGPGDSVVDVGANWGLHTLLLSRLVGSAGRVAAFECFPPALDDLDWHIRANRLRNVTVVRAAVADAEGCGAFVPGESPYTGRLTFDPAESRRPGVVSVAVRTLDEAVATCQLPSPSLVKIDVEGAESRVLLGAQLLVTRCRPDFIIDLHTPDQDLAVAKWLTERGYRLSRVDGPPIRRVDRCWPASDGVWGTIVARHGSKFV